MKPLVSIVVPVYNSEKYIEDTIQSVLNQIYTNWELIFVDDASTDASVRMIKKYETKKIKLYQNKENKGVGYTRNVGISNSKGRFIAFLDSDDKWVKEKLEKQVEFMLQNNYVFTYTNYIFSDSNCNPTGNKIKVKEKCNYKDYLKSTTIWTSTVMFDMKYFKKEDIYMPNIRMGEDGSTWLKILKKIEYAYGLDEYLSYYRRRKHSLSSNKIRCVIRVWDLYKSQNLGFFKTVYYFVHYVINAIRKRI